MALTLGDTLSLRVDQYSRLRFENDTHVALLRAPALPFPLAELRLTAVFHT